MVRRKEVNTSTNNNPMSNSAFVILSAKFATLSNLHYTYLVEYAIMS